MKRNNSGTAENCFLFSWGLFCGFVCLILFVGWVFCLVVCFLVVCVCFFFFLKSELTNVCNYLQRPRSHTETDKLDINSALHMFLFVNM